MQDFARAFSAATSEGFRLVELDPPVTPQSALPSSTLPVSPVDVLPSDVPALPLYRLVAAFVADGKGPDIIATLLGIPEDKVRYLIKSPEVAKLLNDLPQLDQSRLVDSILQSTVVDSILVLQSIRDDKENSATVRLNASKELLDRALGRPEAISKSRQLGDPDKLPADPVERARYLSAEIEHLLSQPGIIPAKSA